MSKANEPLSYDQHQEIESQTSTYLKVFIALLVFTIMEYAYAMLVQEHLMALILGLLAMALTKATLVAMFFMHLKFEGRWVYMLLIPTGFLASALVLAMLPDLGLHAPEAQSSVGEFLFPFARQR
jgi:cytochrome c oxidase subunit 4